MNYLCICTNTHKMCFILGCASVRDDGKNADFVVRPMLESCLQQ